MDETWFAPICAYCERSDAGFWSEPVNALSNAGFLVAAGAAAWRARTAHPRDAAALALAAIVAGVGIGSFLFHTFANRWSLLADVIPIAIFIYAFFYVALRRFFGLSRLTALGATLLFAGFNLGLEPTLDRMTGRSVTALTNGSILYLPAFLALVSVGAGLLARSPARVLFDEAAPVRRKKSTAKQRPRGATRSNVIGCGSNDRIRREAGVAMLAIAALFLVSLSFRTADLALCGRFPVGTHFLWHLINAGVLFGLIVTAMRIPVRAARPVTPPPMNAPSIPS